jgi:6-phosphogluconolactonase
MNAFKNNWHVYSDEQSLSMALAQDILAIAEKSIFEKDCFSIVLTGGKSALSLYKILSKSDSNWIKWNIYISDERLLPKNHKDRNDRLINKIWLDSLKIPKKNIYFIKSELGYNDGVGNYEKVLSNVDIFDVVLLSIGEDGHAASLFPGHDYESRKNVVIETNSPKIPKGRISMSYSRLNKSKNVFKIVNGTSKKRAVDMWLQGVELPISQIKGFCEKVYACTDAMHIKYYG